MSVKERLKTYLKSEHITERYFATSVGVSSGYVSSMSQSIQPDKLERISIQFPNLNTGWLMTGEGEMLKPQNVFSQPTEDNVMMSREIFDLLKQQTETIHSQQRTIEALTAKKMDAQQTAAAGCADVG